MQSGNDAFEEQRFMDNLRIGIVTSPLGEAGRTPLSNLVKVVDNRSHPTHVLTGNAALDFFNDTARTTVTGLHHREGGNALLRIVRHLSMQLRLALLMAERTSLVDTWIFFIGSDGLVVPMVMAKLTRKTTLLALAGSDEESLRFGNDHFFKLVRVLSIINRGLSDRLVIYSWSLVKEWHLERYRSKVSIARHHFIDFTRFRATRSLETRDNIIGYVGRMSEEKGILQFMKAIPEAMKRDPSLRFVVAGDGPLADLVNQYVRTFGLGKSVRLTGWITHRDLPNLLNELKLIVIPSYTEGLPSVALEAMACGTPVLAAPVGAIPDVIKEGETGFMMENNSPETIASNVKRVLQSSDFERVADRAREFVQSNFTFEIAVESWKRVLGAGSADSA